MNGELTSREIADAMGVAERSIRRRADREGWPCAEKKGRGGTCKLFDLGELPEDVRTAVLVHRAKGIGHRENENLPVAAQGSGIVAQGATQTPSLYKGSAAQAKACGYGIKDGKPAAPALNEREKKTALARADLVRLYQEHLRTRRWGGKGPARESFQLAYNSGAAYPHLYSILGETSWKTIERWKVSLRTHGDAFLLADRRGKVRRGATVLNPDHMRILTACACHPNRPNMAEAIRMARAVMHVRGIQNGHSDDTYRRFLLDFRDHNFHIWTWMREGEKAWNDKVALSIERDITLLNVGDILVADGHVLNFEVLNPWTGKPKRMTLILWYDMRSNYPTGWDIMPTEDTQTIASALRRAILRLGFVPRVAYLDNGRAFGARFFQGQNLADCGIDGVFGRLDIKTIFAWPYHAQSKTIERFFKTFGELERWMPTYVGGSIDTKPPRMNRGEVIHRKIYDKIMGGQSITLEQAHFAIATWFDEYARRPQRGHLEGACPIDVFEEGCRAQGAGHRAITKEALRELMLKMEVKQIQANGVKHLGRHYYAPELYGRRHPILMGYDFQDPTSIEVYDRESGEHLCTAHHLGKVHPAARLLGTDEDVDKLKTQLAIKGAQKREARGPATAFLEAEVLPEYRRMLDAQGISPAGEGSGLRVQGSEKQETRGGRRAADIRVLRTQLDIEEEQGRAVSEATGTDGVDGIRAMFSPEATEARLASTRREAARPFRSSIEDPFEDDDE